VRKILFFTIARVEFLLCVCFEVDMWNNCYKYSLFIHVSSRVSFTICTVTSILSIYKCYWGECNNHFQILIFLEEIFGLILCEVIQSNRWSLILLNLNCRSLNLCRKKSCWNEQFIVQCTHIPVNGPMYNYAHTSQLKGLWLSATLIMQRSFLRQKFCIKKKEKTKLFLLFLLFGII